MMDKRWYIFSQCAEEDSFGVIDLTADEAAVVYRVTNADIIKGGGYTGAFRLSLNSYATRDEAVSVVHDWDKFSEVDFC